jgi:Protein of unknown function (DUF3618)
MAETTADVRRDIELTRERMSSTLAELERKLDLAQLVRDHPWSALAIAVGAGVVLSGSRADVKAAGTRIVSALDEVVATLVGRVNGAIDQRVSGWVDDLKVSLTGAPARAPSPPTGSGYGVGPIDDLPDGPAAGIGGKVVRAD